MAPSAAKRSSRRWKAATRPSCRSRLLYRRFSLELAATDNRRRTNRSLYMNEDEFEDRLKALRPRLHRYCARMTGSAVDGEDVLEDTLVKAFPAPAPGTGG